MHALSGAPIVARRGHHGDAAAGQVVQRLLQRVSARRHEIRAERPEHDHRNNIREVTLVGQSATLGTGATTFVPTMLRNPDARQFGNSCR